MRPLPLIAALVLLVLFWRCAGARSAAPPASAGVVVAAALVRLRLRGVHAPEHRRRAHAPRARARKLDVPARRLARLPRGRGIRRAARARRADGRARRRRRARRRHLDRAALLPRVDRGRGRRLDRLLARPQARARLPAASTGRASTSRRRSSRGSRGSSTCTAARRSSSAASSASRGRSRRSWPEPRTSRYRRFLMYDIPGAGAWAACFLAVGYVVAASASRAAVALAHDRPRDRHGRRRRGAGGGRRAAVPHRPRGFAHPLRAALGALRPDSREARPREARERRGDPVTVMRSRPSRARPRRRSRRAAPGSSEMHPGAQATASGGRCQSYGGTPPKPAQLRR